MSLRLWEFKYFKDIGWFPIPKFYPECKYCSSLLIPHRINVGYNIKENQYFLDINLKCPLCGNYEIFGISISREEYELLRQQPYIGKIIKDNKIFKVWIETIGVSEEILNVISEKLKKWGYW